MNWAYIAGFFDGEGSVTHRKGLPDYIVFSNTNSKVIKEIHAFIGTGRIYKYKQQNPKWKSCYNLRLTLHGELIPVLKQMLPYLVIKRVAVESLLKRLVNLHSWNQAPSVIDKNFSKRVKNLYWRRGMSGYEIAKLTGVQAATVYYDMERSGVPRRSRQLAAQKRIVKYPHTLPNR